MWESSHTWILGTCPVSLRRRKWRLLLGMSTFLLSRARGMLLLMWRNVCAPLLPWSFIPTFLQVFCKYPVPHHVPDLLSFISLFSYVLYPGSQPYPTPIISSSLLSYSIFISSQSSVGSLYAEKFWVTIVIPSNTIFFPISSLFPWNVDYQLKYPVLHISKHVLTNGWLTLSVAFTSFFWGMY